jgi:hypothetical protein
MADFLNEIPERDREKVTRALNSLLASTFLLRDIYDDKAEHLRTNEEYSLIERHLDFVRAWFDVAGWDLHRDTSLGVIYCQNRLGLNRIRLDKAATMLLLAARLAYEEEREKLSLRKEVVVSIRGLLDRLLTIGVIDKKLPDRALRDGINLLTNFRLIERLDGPAHEPDTRLVIYPSILLAIDNQRIARLARALKEAGEEDEDETP